MVFKTIGVIGGGTMGQGIAEMLAARGLGRHYLLKKQQISWNAQLNRLRSV